DPGSGRFTAEDPIGADPANPYRYVGNSPTNATDPSGLWSRDGVIAALVRAGRADGAGGVANGNVAISDAVAGLFGSGQRAYVQGGRVYFDIPAGDSDEQAAAYILGKAESETWNPSIYDAFKGWLWDQLQGAIANGGDIGAARQAYYGLIRRSAADLGLAAYDIIKNVYLLRNPGAQLADLVIDIGENGVNEFDVAMLAASALPYVRRVIVVGKGGRTRAFNPRD